VFWIIFNKTGAWSFQIRLGSYFSLQHAESEKIMFSFDHLWGITNGDTS